MDGFQGYASPTLTTRPTLATSQALALSLSATRHTHVSTLPKTEVCLAFHGRTTLFAHQAALGAPPPVDSEERENAGITGEEE